jgi:hypothetical protein
VGLCVSNLGAQRLMDWCLFRTQASDEDMQVRLFKNDLEPIRTTALADFTEADFLYYLRRNLLRNQWATSDVDGAGVNCVYIPDQTWPVGSSGQTVYGYFIVSQRDNRYLWGERFDTPFVLVAGVPLTITLRLSGGSLLP